MDELIEKCQKQLSEGYFEGALESSEERLAQEPKDGLAWRMNGLALQGLGQIDKAEESFKNAVRYGKADPENHHSYAVLLFNSKRFEEALILFEAAAVLENSPKRLFMVAITDLMLSRQLDAILVMREAMAINKREVLAIAESFSEKYFKDSTVSERDKQTLKAQLNRIMKSA